MRSNNIVESAYLDVETTFAPFVRRHETREYRYYETTKTIICLFTLFPIRILLFFASFMLMFIPATFVTICSPTSSSTTFIRKTFIRFILQPLSKVALFSVGVLWVKRKKLEWKDLPLICEQYPSPIPNQYPHAQVIVSNHLGWLDMILLEAKYGCSFIAKADIQKVPIVKNIAEALQTIYLKKDGKSTTQTVIDRVMESYSPDGLHNLPKLCIFPEGTTTNGKFLVKFRTGIFSAGKPVMPVILSYPNRFSLSWESIHFHEHIFRTMTQFINFVEIIELPVYSPSPAEIADPHLYAENVEHLFSHVLQQPIYRLNRKHKTLYHNVLLGKCTEREALIEAEAVTRRDKSLQHRCTNKNSKS